MESGRDPLDAFAAALPPAPRPAPVEFETLLFELRMQILRLSLIAAVGLTLAAAWNAPAAIREYRLRVRGIEAEGFVREAPEYRPALWFSEPTTLSLSFIESGGSTIHARVPIDSNSIRGLERHDRLLLRYDPYDPHTLRLLSRLDDFKGDLAGDDPIARVALLSGLALLLPLFAALAALRIAARRRRAFEYGVPERAKVRGYRRYFGIHQLLLELESGKTRTVSEAIAPAEFDRYQPLTRVITLSLPADGGGVQTATICALDPLTP